MTSQGISVKSNKSRRTFTIRTNGNKYRTVQMTKQDFEEMEYYTEGDWAYFLRTQSGCEYYAVK